MRHCLKEKELEYESKYVELWRYENLNPAYLMLNPNGVVPTLVHNGVAIINAAAILEYIEDAFPNPPFRPEDPGLKAQMRHWIWMGDYVHQAIIDLTYSARLKSLVTELSDADKDLMIASTPMPDRRERWRRMSADGYNANEIQAALDVVDYSVGWLERTLTETPWLAGHQMSLADIYLLSNVHRIRELYPEKLQPETFPNIKSWQDKLMARPAAAATYAAGTTEAPSRPDGKSVDGINADLSLYFSRGQ